MNDIAIIGTVIAVILSYSKNESIGWGFIHGLFGWWYVIYYLLIIEKIFDV